MRISNVLKVARNMSSTRKIDLFLWRNDIFSVPSKISTSCGRRFEVEERISAGGNGVVYRCVEATTGSEYAIKFLLKYDGANKRLRRFEFERTQLEHLLHDHLVRFVARGAVVSGRLRNGKKSQKRVEFFVMELAESGNLRDLSSRGGFIREEIYKPQFRGLAAGLKAIHDQDVVHRDIKPENILVSGEKWLLCDFGLCAPLSRTGRDITGNENVGPRFWMSPEMSNRCLGVDGLFSKIGKASDVFQLASVFWFIVNRRHPSGIIERDDWRGPPVLFPVMKRALEHCPKRRTLDGGQFHEELCAALEG